MELLLKFFLILVILSCQLKNKKNAKGKKIKFKVLNIKAITIDCKKTKTKSDHYSIKFDQFYRISDVFLLNTIDVIEGLFLINQSYISELKKAVMNIFSDYIIQVIIHLISPLGDDTRTIKNFIKILNKENKGFIVFAQFKENFDYKLEPLLFKNSYFVAVGSGLIKQLAKNYEHIKQNKNEAEIKLRNTNNKSYFVNKKQPYDYFIKKLKKFSLGQYNYIETKKYNDEHKAYKITCAYRNLCNFVGSCGVGCEILNNVSAIYNIRIKEKSVYFLENNNSTYPLVEVNEKKNYKTIKSNAPFFYSKLTSTPLYFSYGLIFSYSSIRNDFIFYFEKLKDRENRFLFIKSINFVYNFNPVLMTVKGKEKLEREIRKKERKKILLKVFICIAFIYCFFNLIKTLLSRFTELRIKYL